MQCHGATDFQLSSSIVFFDCLQKIRLLVLCPPSDSVADPGFGQERGQLQRGPQALVGLSSCDAPSRFEGHRGPFEASDAQRAHYELIRPLRAAQRASSDAQKFPQVSESFQRAPKYLLKLTDHSFGHSKVSFGSRKYPFEAQGWGHGTMAPLWIRHWSDPGQSCGLRMWHTSPNFSKLVWFCLLVFCRASSNMLTGGAIASPVEKIAPPPPPVTDICPSSENLKLG